MKSIVPILVGVAGLAVVGYIVSKPKAKAAAPTNTAPAKIGAGTIPLPPPPVTPTPQTPAGTDCASLLASVPADMKQGMKTIMSLYPSANLAAADIEAYLRTNGYSDVADCIEADPTILSSL